MKPGCGIILYRNNNGKIEYLGLEAPAHLQTKNKGKWDLPKGIKDGNESDLETAIRETWEETGLLLHDHDLSGETMTVGPLTMYYANCPSHKVPRLLTNPQTGIQEHTSFKWLSGIELYTYCYEWLKPFVKWASSKIEAS